MTNIEKINALINMFTIEAFAARGENHRNERMARVAVLTEMLATITENDMGLSFHTMLWRKASQFPDARTFDMSDADIAEFTATASAKLAKKLAA